MIAGYKIISERHQRKAQKAMKTFTVTDAALVKNFDLHWMNVVKIQEADLVSI
jgi:hypothetical protein